MNLHDMEFEALKLDQPRLMGRPSSIQALP